MTKIRRQDILVWSLNRLVLLKAAQTKRGNVYKRRPSLGDQLGHTGPDGGGDFKASATKPGGHIEPVDARRTIEDGPGVRADVIHARMPTGVRGLCEGRKALPGFGTRRWDVIRIVGLIVGIRIGRRFLSPLPHADQRQVLPMGSEIRPNGTIDEDHVTLGEFDGPVIESDMGPLRGDGRRQPEGVEESGRPRPREHYDDRGSDGAG